MTLIIVLTVISSPVVMLFNPQDVLANPRVTDTSSSHATMPTTWTSSPSKSSPGTPAIQAPLQIPRTLQSNDLVNSLAFYEVTFITSTTGAIDKIRMDFPAGTGIGTAGIIERIGIGGGTLLKSGSTITYDLTTPVSIPAGTFIRLEMFGIKNPINPSTSFTAMITTRDSDGVPIDGPSQTNVYTIKKIVSSDLADAAVTSSKIANGAVTTGDIAKSLGYQRVLSDGQSNWNPDGIRTIFGISDSLITSENQRIIINLETPPQFSGACTVIFLSTTLASFEVSCSSPPPDTSVLRYAVLNLPAA